MVAVTQAHHDVWHAVGALAVALAVDLALVVYLVLVAGADEVVLQVLEEVFVDIHLLTDQVQVNNSVVELAVPRLVVDSGVQNSCLFQDGT